MPPDHDMNAWIRQGRAPQDATRAGRAALEQAIRRHGVIASRDDVEQLLAAELDQVQHLEQIDSLVGDLARRHAQLAPPPSIGAGEGRGQGPRTPSPDMNEVIRADYRWQRYGGRGL